MPMEASLREVEVLALQPDPPIVLAADTATRTVVAAMRERREGAVLLTREGRLVGIFTERDVVSKLAGGGGSDEQVSDWMTPDPVCVHVHDPIRKVIHLMHSGGFRRMPVIDEDGRPVSCVRHRDVVRYLAEHFATQVLNVSPDPDQVAVRPEGG